MTVIGGGQGCPRHGGPGILPGGLILKDRELAQSRKERKDLDFFDSEKTLRLGGFARNIPIRVDPCSSVVLFSLFGCEEKTRTSNIQLRTSNRREGCVATDETAPHSHRHS
jgi:hypothetical protein